MDKSKEIENHLDTPKTTDIPESEIVIPTQKRIPATTTQGKLSVEEQVMLSVDRARGMSIYDLEEKYGISENTVYKYINGNIGRISEIKQELANRCLGLAMRAQSHITKEKLEKSSASQLTTIARESVYTGIMLNSGKLPDSGSTNIAKLVIETANILQQTIKPKESSNDTAKQTPETLKNVENGIKT